MIGRKSSGETHSGPLATAQDLGHFLEKPLLTIKSVTIVIGIITIEKTHVGLTIYQALFQMLPMN